MFVEARLTALEIRLRQAERALVVERFARPTAKVAQQTVETWPAGVDAEKIGTLPMFSSDLGLGEQSDSVPWSQWSLAIWSFFGKNNRTTAWVLQQVETSVDDPIITDNTVMTRVGKLQLVHRVPRGFGFEAWKLLHEEFEPRPPAKSQGMRSGLKICEEQPGRPRAWDLPSQEVTECLRASRVCETSGSTDPTDLASFGGEEDDGSMKLKEHVGWWEPEHNENECRDSSLVREKKCDRYGTGQCAAVEEDPESSPTEPSGERGTGASSHAAEQDACLLHENGSDQSMYSCVTIWRTWQRHCCIRRGLTWKCWGP